MKTWLGQRHDVLLVDPPWTYEDAIRGDKLPYSSMTLENLMNMRDLVQAITAPRSQLFMWTTGPQFPDAVKLMQHWGFKYKTIAFEWTKLNNNGSEFMGGGNFTRANREWVITGTRGTPNLPRYSKAVRQGLTSHWRGNSVKPYQLRARLEELYGPERTYHEMFARAETIGRDIREAGIESIRNWTFSGAEFDDTDYNFM